MSKRSVALAGAILMALTWSSPVMAQLYGYLEARYLKTDGGGSEVPSYVTVARARPTLVAESSVFEWLTLTVTPQFSMTQYEGARTDYKDSGDYLTVERLYGDIDTDRVDIRVGRQAVNWGSAMIWNPTDVFQEVYLTDYWAEPKGLNAVRAYFPMENNFRLTMVAATGDTVFSDNRYAVKASLARWEADMSVVWMDDAVMDRLVWGVDVKGTRVVGYWVEAAAFAPKSEREDPFEEAVAGVDYSFPVLGTLYLAAQYYYDGSGQSAPTDYDWPALFGGERRTLGMHYAHGFVSIAPDPDFAANLTYIHNLDDSTGILSPHLIFTYGDFRVTAGANVFMGPEGGEFRPDEGQDPLGIVPDTVYYVWGRYFF